MEKMSVEQFKDKVDGLVNDYCERISDEREFKTGILELLLAVTEPFLTGKEEPAPSASTSTRIMKNVPEKMISID